MTIKIELPAAITITSRGQSVTLDMTKLTPEIVARLAVHGATQKVSDAASNATKVAADSGALVDDVTVSLMSKAVDALLKGEWAQRTGGDGVDERTRVARQVTQATVKAKLGATSPEWKAFTGLSDAEQVAKLDEWFADNAEVLTNAVDAEIAERAAKRERKAGLAGKVAIKL